MHGEQEEQQVGGLGRVEHAHYLARRDQVSEPLAELALDDGDGAAIGAVAAEGGAIHSIGQLHQSLAQ